ncbi:MAG TPA: hypothetical protein VH208_11080, partial [Myxococcaceae bacterium]|nr:hypothetical protein [Myxococcaceae bacterium]
MLRGGSGPERVLRSVGPRIISNQTSQPLAFYGAGMRAGDQISLVGATGQRTRLDLTVVDPGHAYARVPAEALQLPPSTAQAEFQLSVR